MACSNEVYVIGKVGDGLLLKCKEAIDYLTQKFPKSKMLYEEYLEEMYEHKIKQLLQERNDEKLAGLSLQSSPLIFIQNRYITNPNQLFYYLQKKYDYEPQYSECEYNAQAKSEYYKLLNNPEYEYVYLNILIRYEDNEKTHQVVLELYKNILPKTVANFVALCKGYRSTSGKNLCYKGTNIHTYKSNGYIVGGDVVNHDGSGGESIYGKYFEDESFSIKHDVPGRIGMVGGKSQHTNNSQFYITSKKLDEFDGKFVAFGTVLKGCSIFNTINQYQNSIRSITIESCGLYDGFHPKEKPEKPQPLSLSFESQDIKAFNNESQLSNLPQSKAAPKYLSFNNINNQDLYTNIVKIQLFQLEKLKFMNSTFNETTVNYFFKRLPPIPQLHSLELRNIYLTDSTIKQFTSKGIQLTLTGLTLFACKGLYEKYGLIKSKSADPVDPVNQISKIEYLLNSLQFSQLHTLDLTSTLLSAENLAKLTKLKLFPKLTALILEDNPLGINGLDSLGTHKKLQIEKLNVKNCGIGSASITKLINGGIIPNLSSLDVSKNYEMDDVVTALALSSSIKGLRSLAAVNCYLTPKSIEKFLLSQNFSQTEMIDLGYNFMLGDSVCETLNKSPFGGQLRQLRLSRNNLTHESLHALENAKHLEKLVGIDLAFNEELKGKRLITFAKTALKKYSDLNLIHTWDCDLTEGDEKELIKILNEKK